MSRDFPPGSICLLTGATGGIGSALAHTLAAAGVRLLLSGRDRGRLATLCASLGADSQAESLVADLSRADDLEALAEEATARRANMLINLSGFNHLALFEHQDNIQAMMQMNAVVPMRLAQLMLPCFQRQPEAIIVNVGSAFGAIGHPGYTTYCASKFALRGFSEALHRELADTRIHVLYMAPRTTATSMNGVAATALNKALGNHTDSPEWVADKICWAIRRRKKSSAFGWPEKLFARVNQLTPTIVDRVLSKKLPLIKKYARPASKF